MTLQTRAGSFKTRVLLDSLVGTFFNPNVAAVCFGACTIAWLLVFAKSD
jgi:hypothetical protein